MYAVKVSFANGHSGGNETIDIMFYDSPERAVAELLRLVELRTKLRSDDKPILTVESGLPSAYFDYGERGTVTISVSHAPID